MKNRYLTAVLLCTIYFSSSSYGQSNYPVETVGSPSTASMVNTYAGWINNGVLNFSGDAQVQNINSSNNLSASGGGNVFFTNTAGTYLQISGFTTATTPASMDITFDMYGYNVNNLNELILEYSTDGINYTALTYRRLFRNYMPPTPWDVMVSDPVPGNLISANLKLRFRQTSNTQQFRIDDIETNFYSTLPVKLISFNAAKIKNDVQVNWVASSTDAHEYFVVEKSVDGRHFNELVNVSVKGVGEFAYNYIDKPSAEKTFYRLKLVDVAGRSSYSQIIFVQTVTNGNLIQSLYPNPAKQILNAQMLSAKQQEAMITLVDLSGKIIYSKSYSLTAGINNCSINISALNSGMYILKISIGELVETKPVIIQ